MERAVLDADELRLALFELGTADVIRLRRAGRLYALGLDCEVHDLLNDAVLGALEGKRRCPRELGIVPFLIGIMRSRASALRDSARRRGVELGLETVAAHGRELAVAAEDVENDAARADEHDRWLKDIRAAFADDPHALSLLEADLAEWSRSEILKRCALNDIQYATIRRRMRRKMNLLFPKGWSDGD